MTEYIDKTTARRAALAPCNKCWIENGKTPVCDGCRLYGVTQAIDKIPAADVRENKRGKWEDAMQSCHDSPHVKCSVCGEYYWRYFNKFNFCPNCGAKMEES